MFEMEKWQYFLYAWEEGWVQICYEVATQCPKNNWLQSMFEIK